ncbi:tetraacyldisaccharide 4'-kinase [Sulfuriflexus mobilis]|uniref:tetraacyldisaccharide 4'-kinase n=1 Tax=Sulfuriflexus mobilis TaxID=1811807 RepID=UPI000F821AC9|nr:tetraacyldisaccharide 4'-kinase [Sulfuriflexus mobilis]
MLRSLLNRLFNRIWYKQSWPRYALMPLTWFYQAMIRLRRHAYERGWKPSNRYPLPVIVVGNITVGGSGKTPLVIWLVDFLRKAGFKPAIISRGYRGKASQWPQQVRADSDPVVVGDEAVLLARRCHCPIAVGPNRSASVEALLQHTDCNIIISDDGLQHYALERDIEIAVVDSLRRYGNGCLLPAGPLREPIERLKDVDFIVSNGIAERGEYAMSLRMHTACNLETGEVRELKTFTNGTVHAMAGIGNPKRFFSALHQQGLKLYEHAFADHHDFKAKDLAFNNTAPVLMTEKDAVKCQRFAHSHYWYVPVEAELNKHFGPRLLAALESKAVKSAVTPSATHSNTAGQA